MADYGSTDFDHDDATQPFFPSGSKEPDVPDNGDGMPRSIEDNDVGDNASTGSCTSDLKDEPHFKVDLHDRGCMVFWEDMDKQEQHSTELRFSLYTDCSRNRALFKLHGPVFLKSRGSSNKRSLFLFIYPENVQSVECGASNRSKMLETRKNASISLCFTMTQPPSLVVPKNQPVNPKKGSQGTLDTIRALAKVNRFTVCLNFLNLAPETREQLCLLPSVFAPHNHLLTDKQRANLDTLYQGQGGEVINSNRAPATCSPVFTTTTPVTAAVQGVEAAVGSKEDKVASPPPYSEHGASGPGSLPGTGFEKRRRPTSEPSSPTTPKSKRVLLAYRHLAKRIDDIESHLKRLEGKMDKLLDAEPCRFDSEERDALFAHVNEKISDDMDSVRFELEDKVLDRADELVTEKTNETPELVSNRTEELWADIKQELLVQMRKEISLQIKEELMAEIALKMAMAFSTGETPKKLSSVAI